MDFSLLADPFSFIAGFGIIGIILVIIASIFWLWMLIDAISNTRLNGAEKIIWVLVVLFLHLLGALLTERSITSSDAGGPVSAPPCGARSGPVV